MNLVKATVAGGKVSFGSATVPLPDGSSLSGTEREVILGVRPTAFSPGEVDGWPTLSVSPAVVEDLGDERYVIFDLDAPRVDTEETRAALDARTADDALLVPDEKRARFTIRLPADAPVTVGEALTVSLDPRRLYFFDPDTSAAIR
jgi:multiple sugar transport system ATP-binding protein